MTRYMIVKKAIEQAAHTRDIQPIMAQARMNQMAWSWSHPAPGQIERKPTSYEQSLMDATWKQDTKELIDEWMQVTYMDTIGMTADQQGAYIASQIMRWKDQM